MEDYVEVFRHLQPFVVEKVMSALQTEDISCYMEAAGPWGRAPVTNPADCLSAPANSYFVMVRKDQFYEAQEIIASILQGEISSPARRINKSKIRITKVHKIGALLGLVFVFVLLFLTIWYALGK
jgi:hypothetical protein